MSDKTFPCPECDGQKKRYHHTLPTYYSGWKPCETCQATGTITEEKKAKLEIGRGIRENRTRLRILIREIAAEFGYSIDDWAKIERGDCELSDSYKARAIIESVESRFVTVFDVWQIAAFGRQQKIKTYDSLDDAEENCERFRKNAKQRNVMEIYQIRERLSDRFNGKNYVG